MPEQIIAMTQTERIQKMEESLDACRIAVKEALAGLEKYHLIRGRLAELSAYYAGSEWKKDFEDDEKGLLPYDLKRGVLSEDGIYHLLEEEKELKRLIKQLAETEE